MKVSIAIDPDARAEDPTEKFVSPDAVEPDDKPVLTGVEFDGVDDFMTVPGIPELTSDDWTFEAWITPRSTKKGTILWIGRPGWTTLEIADGHYMVAAIRDGEACQVSSKAVVVPHQRVHIAGVSKNKELRLFVNGKEHSHTPLKYSANWDTPGPLTISGTNWEQDGKSKRDFFFHGVIDQIRVSPGARYTEEFEPPPVFDIGGELVIFKFDAGTGSTIRDIGRNQHDGILTGGRWVRLTKAGIVVPVDPKVDTSWYGWPADAPKPAVAPFDADFANSPWDWSAPISRKSKQR
jgi:hypothetical protein